MTETSERPARTARQEQEPASDQVTEVAAGILRLQLPVALPGLGHVNTYALEDADGFALVDPGLPGSQSWQALTRRLATAGIPLARVHTVVVTHSHPDHFGGAGQLAEEAGARVVASTHFDPRWGLGDDTELDLAEGPDGDEAAWLDERLARLASTFGRTAPWGGPVPGPPLEQFERLRDHPAEARRWLTVPRPAVRVDDRQRLALAGREWIGLFTPGHTNDHLCLWAPDDGIVLSGDHVLPTITPHISGLIADDPLATYFESLDRVAAIDGVELVLPAHGHPFDDLPGRVASIKVHHDQRLDRLADISAEIGWGTVEGYAQRLFSPRSWGAMANSEAYAHLEHLRLAGRAERDEAFRYLVHPLA